MNTLLFNLRMLFDPHDTCPALVSAMQTAIESRKSGGLNFRVQEETCQYTQENAIDPDRLYLLFEWGGDDKGKNGWWISAPIDLLLAPWNVIPGGYAGIRLLHKLGLTKNKKPNPEQRDEVLLRLEHDGRAGPSAHYRRGHVRNLSLVRKTWVRACFVALGGLLPEGLYAQS